MVGAAVGPTAAVVVAVEVEVVVGVVAAGAAVVTLLEEAWMEASGRGALRLRHVASVHPPTRLKNQNPSPSPSLPMRAPHPSYEMASRRQQMHTLPKKYIKNRCFFAPHHVNTGTRRGNLIDKILPPSLPQPTHAQNKQKPNSKLICFGCRGTGHSLRDCRVTKGGAQGGERGKKTCYNCGSEDHAARDCKAPNSNFKFAVCFTCGETGHLVRACPKNAQGIYINGGACKICKGTDHLAKDCPSFGKCLRCGEKGHMAAECTGGGEV